MIQTDIVGLFIALAIFNTGIFTYFLKNVEVVMQRLDTFKFSWMLNLGEDLGVFGCELQADPNQSAEDTYNQFREILKPYELTRELETRYSKNRPKGVLYELGLNYLFIFISGIIVILSSFCKSNEVLMNSIIIIGILFLAPVLYNMAQALLTLINQENNLRDIEDNL